MSNESDAAAVGEGKKLVYQGSYAPEWKDLGLYKRHCHAEGHLEFFRHSGDKKIPILSEYDYVVGAHNPGARTFKPVGDGLFHSELHFAARDGERLYGMGENATGRVNLKGSVIDLYQRHVKGVVPFVVSSEGYGLLWNNPSFVCIGT